MSKHAGLGLWAPGQTQRASTWPSGHPARRKTSHAARTLHFASSTSSEPASDSSLSDSCQSVSHGCRISQHSLGDSRAIAPDCPRRSRHQDNRSRSFQLTQPGIHVLRAFVMKLNNYLAESFRILASAALFCRAGLPESKTRGASSPWKLSPVCIC